MRRFQRAPLCMMLIDLVAILVVGVLLRSFWVTGAIGVAAAALAVAIVNLVLQVALVVLVARGERG